MLAEIQVQGHPLHDPGQHLYRIIKGEGLGQFELESIKVVDVFPTVRLYEVRGPDGRVYRDEVERVESQYFTSVQNAIVVPLLFACADITATRKHPHEEAIEPLMDANIKIAGLNDVLMEFIQGVA